MHSIGSLKSEPQPSQDISMLSTGDKIRLLYDYVTNPTWNDGLDVNDSSIEGIDIFALHDQEFNNRWIKSWASKIALNDDDIEMVRDQFGEKV
jgi:hypothetical protein